MKALPNSVQKPHPPNFIGCACKWMLSLAAREANSISIMFRIPKQGVDSMSVTLEQKIAWVREAAGGRIAHPRLNQMTYNLMITG